MASQPWQPPHPVHAGTPVPALYSPDTGADGLLPSTQAAPTPDLC